MANKMNLQKRCIYCGQFFCPDYRVGEKQKSCKKKGCQQKRKKESQKKWKDKNIGYYEEHYSLYIKGWREAHPKYQKQWRAKKRRQTINLCTSEIKDKIPPENPIRIMRLVVPEDWVKGEIKDEIRLVKQCGCGFYVTGKVNEIKDENVFDYELR